MTSTAAALVPQQGGSPRPLRDLWRDLATTALGVVPARVPPLADAADLGAVIDDIDLLETVITKIVTGYGDVVKDNFSGVDPDHFKQITDYVSDTFGQLRTHLSNVREDMQIEEDERDSSPRKFLAVTVSP